MFGSTQLVKESSTPLYQQLYSHVRTQVLCGNLQPGERLPSSRQLARTLGISRITVTQAYEQLADEGFVETRVGAGTFVADYLPSADESAMATAVFAPKLSGWGERVMAIHPVNNKAAHRPEIDFGFGRSFPHIFPYDIWRRLLARYLSTDDVMLSRYGSVSGFLPLREALADYLQRLRGVHCLPEQVVIVNGAQQVLDILSRLYVSSGAEVLVETPGYANAFELFQAFGAHIQALSVDDEGFPVEKIPKSINARLVFVTPSNQFPHGGTMPLQRRTALLQWARERQALIVEDDYDGELRYEGRPLTALQGLDHDGRVVYLGTFSKVLFPALRLSYVVLPQTMVEPFVQAKGLVDRGAPTLTQAAVADFIREGHFERHLRRLRQAYGRRWQVLVQALDTHLADKVRFARVPAGLHVMLYLAEDLSETAVVQKAADVGVGVYPGRPYHLQKPAPPSILLGFSGLTEADIQEGVSRLANIL